MITTLMMLLGLSGAGAGLYNVIKNPSEPSDAGEDNRPPSRRKRSRGDQKENEIPEKKLPDSKKKGTPPPEWGGRGEELPFQTPKPEEGRLPRGDARPLPEGLPSLEDWTSEEEPQESSTRSKRRRNRKIEEEPESLAEVPLGDYGSGQNESPSDEKRNSGKPRGDSPEISFPADDIISKNSKYSFHRRPLLNAEALIEKNNFDEAIEIFQRTGDRIPDPEIKNKIQKNITDIEEFVEDLEAERAQQESLAAAEKPKGKPITDFGSAQKIPRGETGYEDFVTAMKQVAEVFADSIAKAIQYAQSPVPQSPNQQTSDLPTGSFPNPKDPIGQPSRTIPELPPQGNVGADFLHPLIYQFLKDSPPLPGYAGMDTKEEKQNYESLIKSLNQGLMSPPQSGMPMPFTGGGNAPGIVGPFYLPNPDQLKTDFTHLSGALNEAAEGAKNLADITSSFEKAKSEIKDKEISDLDLPEDTFFSDEWQNFRGLPLVDRRIGGERRKNADRRENKAGRKDRRSGVDRRKIDRFKEREEYLKNKALEKLEEAAKRAQTLAPPSLNDLLKPYFPPVPERLNLPDGRDLREREDKPREEIPKPEEWIEGDPDWFDKTTEALRKEVTLPDPVDPKAPTLDMPLIGLPDPIDPTKAKSETIIETDDPIQVELTARAQEESLKIGLPDPEEAFRDRVVKKEAEEEEPEFDEEPPEIELVDGELGEISEAKETPDEMANKIEEEPEKIIHGVLELKPPEADDAPFLTLTYDFGKIPHAFRLSKNYSIMEYSYYKYKPMLMKAQEFARRKMLKNALNYYRVIKSQNIPPELRKMINRNIRDITEFMEKFLMAKGG